MRARRAGGLSLVVGLALLIAPLYWEALLRLGVTPALDPAAAIGAAPGGGYPSAVGAAAATVGVAVVWLSERGGPPTPIVLAGSVGGAVLGVLAATALASVPLPLAVQVGLAGAAPGFAAVRGAATDRAPRRLGAGLVVASMVPLAGAHLVRGATVGGMAGFASLVLAVAIVAYTALLSYPFYRLGRTAR